MTHQTAPQVYESEELLFEMDPEGSGLRLSMIVDSLNSDRWDKCDGDFLVYNVCINLNVITFFSRAHINYDNVQEILLPPKKIKRKEVKIPKLTDVLDLTVLIAIRELLCLIMHVEILTNGKRPQMRIS